MIKKTTTTNPEKSISRVRVGCTVEFEYIPSGTIKALKLIPSHSETRYTTMGYKTKKYSNVIRVSEADGVKTFSDISPMGKACINKRVGDLVEFKVKDSVQRCRILSITTE